MSELLSNADAAEAAAAAESAGKPAKIALTIEGYVDLYQKQVADQRERLTQMRRHGNEIDKHYEERAAELVRKFEQDMKDLAEAKRLDMTDLETKAKRATALVDMSEAALEALQEHL